MRNPFFVAPPNKMSNIPLSKIAKGITLEAPPPNFESWSKNLYGKAFHREKNILDQAQEMSKPPFTVVEDAKMDVTFLHYNTSSCMVMIYYFLAN